MLDFLVLRIFCTVNEILKVNSQLTSIPYNKQLVIILALVLSTTQIKLIKNSMCVFEFLLEFNLRLCLFSVVVQDWLH